MSFLEIACFNASSIPLAQRAGASRIEFCADQGLGGTTPSVSILKSLKANSDGQGSLAIPINVMIRPRGGDFLYSTTEYETMKQDMRGFRNLADGFVFGILTPDGRVDVERNRDLVNLAGGKSCTFHRAFDQIEHSMMQTAIDNVIECGFKAVLTSGGRDTAVDGAEVLRRLVDDARGRIEIIVGGGVRAENIIGLKLRTRAMWFHSSATLNAIGDSEDELVADEDEIRRMKEALEG